MNISWYIFTNRNNYYRRKQITSFTRFEELSPPLFTNSDVFGFSLRPCRSSPARSTLDWLPLLSSSPRVFGLASSSGTLCPSRATPDATVLALAVLTSQAGGVSLRSFSAADCWMGNIRKQSMVYNMPETSDGKINVDSLAWMMCMAHLFPQGHEHPTGHPRYQAAHDQNRPPVFVKE